jgi:hypothetical protein
MPSRKELEAWLKREYPDRPVDWRAEYERLLGVVEQSLPVLKPFGVRPDPTSALGVLQSAHTTGTFLVRNYGPDGRRMDVHANALLDKHRKQGGDV